MNTLPSEGQPKEGESMSCLSGFPPPPEEGKITLYEINARFIAESLKTAELSKYVPATQGLNYPIISKDTESVRTGKNLWKLPDDEWSPFVQTRESIYKKLLSAWHFKGFSEMLLEIKRNKEEVPSWLWHLSIGTEAVYKQFSFLYGKVFPHLNLSNEQMISEFSPVSSWISSPVRAFAWHPHVAKFVIAWKDDSVKVYTLKSDLVPLLKHKQQRNVSCVAWRPLSASVLVLAVTLVSLCGLLILLLQLQVLGIEIDRHKSEMGRLSPQTARWYRLGSSSVCHTPCPGHTPVTTVSWSPSGQLLVSGSPADSHLMVWDVALESATPLYRAGGGITLTSWSPDERKIFAATPSGLFRVWETQCWTCEKWSNLAGTCKAACWSPDGSILVFSVADEPSIYSLHFEVTGDKENKASMAKGAHMAVKCADLTKYTWEVEGESIAVGGCVQSMTWDPLGQRLAVVFRDEDNRNCAQEHVAVFQTRLKPTFEVMPSGFVKGPPGAFPELVAFQQDFKKGALLTVVDKETFDFEVSPGVWENKQSIKENRGTFEWQWSEFPKTE